MNASLAFFSRSAIDWIQQKSIQRDGDGDGKSRIEREEENLIDLGVLLLIRVYSLLVTLMFYIWLEKKKKQNY
jgi:hypothetical protein